MSVVRGQPSRSTPDAADILKRKARDFGIYAEAFLKSRGHTEKIGVVPVDGDFLVQISINGDVQDAFVPGSATWPDAKRIISEHIVARAFTDADIPF